MSRKALFTLIAVVVILGTTIGLVAAISYYSDLPNRLSQHETIILGQTAFVPGSQAGLRVLVRDSKNAAPLSGAKISVAMRPKDGGAGVTLFEGTTGSGGTANVSFKVPTNAATDQMMVISTSSSLGQDSVERAVTVKRDYRVLLTTDKPIYQPGQVIHLRGLALSAFDMVAASGQPLELIIADGKGNKVFRKTVTTSAYGVVAADFELASEVNTGNYKITAKLGSTSSEKTVRVEPYALPKFDVNLKTQKTYYVPGERVRGSLNAVYFFGKPVSKGEVQVEGFTFDVQQNVTVTLQGQTDKDGNYEFEFDLPRYITGTDLDKGIGRFYIQAQVIDQTQHGESASLSIPVAGSGLVVDAIPEGGSFRPNVENILYVLTSYPDGSPAEANITVTLTNQKNEIKTAATGPYGLAEVRFTPTQPYQNIRISAREKRGASVERTFNFQGQYSEETVLLRPEKPVYKVGESMKLTILTSNQTGTVYLDILRENQTVSTRAVEVQKGQSDVVVDLTPDLYGTLTLNAYKILRSGSIVRDQRLVVVDQAEGLKISLKPGQETYKPGDAGSLNINVQGSDGKGAQSVLGIAIVDESVFALAEQDPGFAKLYFLLEKELMEPKYDLHGYSVPEILTGTVPSSDPQLVRAVNGAAQASLAVVAAKGGNFSLQVNSRQENIKKTSEIQQTFFGGLTQALMVFFALIPLGVVGITGFSLWRQKVLGRSLLIMLAFIILTILAILFWPIPGLNNQNVGFLERLFSLLSEIFAAQTVAFALIAGLICMLILLIVAIRRKDGGILWTMAFLVLFAGVAILMAFSASKNSRALSNAWVGWALAAYLLLPAAFLLRFGGFAVKKQIWLAVASLIVTFFFVFGVLPMIGLAGGAMAPGVVMVEDNVRREFLAGGIAATKPAMALAATQALAANKGAEKDSGTGGTTGAEPPRLRQYFPETMLWLPEAVTGPDGKLALNVPVADSITTWRITALASTQDGRLGSTSGPLRVFQDFFIDLDLPQALTVGDEVSIPVGVFNYLPTEQTVRLELSKQPWFELLDEAVKEMKIAANEINVVYFKIRATNFGRQPFKVTALGSKMSDAIQKEVQVYPNGKQVQFSQADRLTPGKPVVQSIKIPVDAISGTQKLNVKIYPGILSQVVEGMDSILRMPNGCFEQTSSTTYPNVLVLDYLKATNQSAPEVRMKAEQYINLGYQRLTTFEVKNSGGFSLFGNEPADRMLTAYGLQEFSDMSRVHEVDPELLKRAGRWLITQQESDGSWKNDRGLVHENTWQQLGNDRLPVTAYITWSLVDAGFGGEAGTKKGLDYVRENAAQATDPYALALVANALVSADVKSGGKLSQATDDVLTRLAGMAQRDGDRVFWTSKVATFMGGKGDVGSIETTALAAYALLRADRQPDLANGALTFLIKQKDSFGTWHSTQATVLALKALLQSVRQGGEKINATVTVTLNGGQAKVIKITPANFDVVQLVTFDDVNPGAGNKVELKVEGQGNLMYQVSGSYYLPWQKVSAYPELFPAGAPVAIQVAYDRTQLAVNDIVKVTVTVKLNQSGARAEQALIDLGIPPGFSVLTEDLTSLVERFKDIPKNYPNPILSRFELTGRQVLVYANNLQEGKPLVFSYRLKARFPLAAQAPASTAYDYYNPGITGENAPQMLVVKP